jgi:hypothetical protein
MEYRVRTKRVLYEDVFIEADTPQDALMKVSRGEGAPENAEIGEYFPEDEWLVFDEQGEWVDLDPL